MGFGSVAARGRIHLQLRDPIRGGLSVGTARTDNTSLGSPLIAGQFQIPLPRGAQLLARRAGRQGRRPILSGRGFAESAQRAVLV